MNNNRILKNKEKIYPWVKASIDNISEPNLTFDSETTPAYKNWLGNLKVLYAIDLDDKVSFIFKSEIPDGYSIDEIHEIAIQNLERDIEYEVGQLNFQGGFGLLAGGDYEASSITLHSIWEWIAEQLDDDLLVGIPAKDMVFLTAFSDTNGIIDLAKSIKEIFADGENLLSKSIFKYSKVSKEWSVFKEASF